MEKEITSFDFFAMVVDLVYKVFMFVLCIGTAFYVVHDKGFVLLAVLSILAILLKTVAGLFNGSLLVDILQYYMDLGIALFFGNSMGLIYQAYISVKSNPQSSIPTLLPIPLITLIVIPTIQFFLNLTKLNHNFLKTFQLLY